MPNKTPYHAAFYAAALCALPMLFTPSVHAQTGAKKTATTGKMVVVLPVNKQKTPKHELAYQFIKQGELLSKIATMMNGSFNFPRNLTITTSESDEVNAYYTEKDHSITLNYGMVNYVLDGVNAAKTPAQQKEAISAGVGLLVFTMLHEMGHAFIHEFKIPVLGREEDAADQLATYILARGKQVPLEESVYHAARFFLDSSKNNVQAGKIAWADEHSIGPQRYINIISWLYGSNPEKLGVLVTSGILPKNRAARSVSEYQTIDQSWSKLLKPHRKK